MRPYTSRLPAIWATKGQASHHLSGNPVTSGDLQRGREGPTSRQKSARRQAGTVEVPSSSFKSWPLSSNSFTAAVNWRMHFYSSIKIKNLQESLQKRPERINFSMKGKNVFFKIFLHLFLKPQIPPTAETCTHHWLYLRHWPHRMSLVSYTRLRRISCDLGDCMAAPLSGSTKRSTYPLALASHMHFEEHKTPAKFCFNS